MGVGYGLYMHNVVYIINMLDCTQGCVYNIIQIEIMPKCTG